MRSGATNRAPSRGLSTTTQEPDEDELDDEQGDDEPFPVGPAPLGDPASHPEEPNHPPTTDPNAPRLYRARIRGSRIAQARGNGVAPSDRARRSAERRSGLLWGLR